MTCDPGGTSLEPFSGTLGDKTSLSAGVAELVDVNLEMKGLVLLPQRENLRDGKIPEHLDVVMPETTVGLVSHSSQ